MSVSHALQTERRRLRQAHARTRGGRFAQLLLAMLPSREMMARSQHDSSRAPSSAGDVQGPELADQPEMRAALAAIGPTGLDDVVPGLPEELVAVPGRRGTQPHVTAAGFADDRSETVGVDVACWHAPPDMAINERAWRRVFTWVVGCDRGLCHVAVLSAPADDEYGVVASYGYEAEGVPGIGVLRVTALSDGRWRIVDCWGDACETDRVQQLAQQLAAMPAS